MRLVLDLEGLGQWEGSRCENEWHRRGVRVQRPVYAATQAVEQPPRVGRLIQGAREGKPGTFGERRGFEVVNAGLIRVGVRRQASLGTEGPPPALPQGPL